MHFQFLSSPVEVDDAYENAGHKGNGHRSDRPTSSHGRRKELGRDPRKRGKRTKKGRGSNAGRVPLVGAVSRVNRNTVVELVPNLSKQNVYPTLKQYIPKGSTVYTDDQATYWSLAQEGYKHQMVIHKKEWINGDCHTNTIENPWSSWRAFSRVHRGFSVEHLPIWAGWFVWLRDHVVSATEWLGLLLDDALQAPAKILRHMVAQAAMSALCLIFTCQGSNNT